MCYLATGLPATKDSESRAQGNRFAKTPAAMAQQKPLSTTAAERMNLVAQDEIW